MTPDQQHEERAEGSSIGKTKASSTSRSKGSSKSSEKNVATAASVKRRCVSTACIACRRRKSKCDGNTPSCAACASVYGTECVYDPSSDHRRKGVYKRDIDSLKTRNSTLQTLIQGVLNYPEEEVLDLVRQIRTCESLDEVAETIITREAGQEDDDDRADESPLQDGYLSGGAPRFESELSSKMGELRLDDGLFRHVGGTSNLIFLTPGEDGEEPRIQGGILSEDEYEQQQDPIPSWTEVTSDIKLIVHLLNMYFTWHYSYFTTLSKDLFQRDFMLGKPRPDSRRTNIYCTSLLVNAMLALGCHFTAVPGSRADPEDSATAGDHFFREAKRLILENDEHEKPKLPTVQALALMSVREAGCGREAKGWIYSGMSFRMAGDLGLNLHLTYSHESNLDEREIDARKITFWGCFLFDKCWSNYLGRQPQLAADNTSVPKIDVFPSEDAALWCPYTDEGSSEVHAQPSRTRAVALQISALCEISSDLLVFFYHPTNAEKHTGKSAELKKLSELHTRLEAWKNNLPKEMEAKEGALPSVLVMHMFFELLFIHLYRPFLKYSQSASPLPAHVSPRKLCSQAASLVSKLLRIYKRTYGLRQICNIAVYIVHSACTIHLLNLPDKNARRDIVHGVKHLEEIAESWLCARRTLHLLGLLARRWKIELPEEATTILKRTYVKFGPFSPEDSSSSPRSSATSPSASGQKSPQAQHFQNHIPQPGSAWRAQAPPQSSHHAPVSLNQAGPSMTMAASMASGATQYIPPVSMQSFPPPGLQGTSQQLSQLQAMTNSEAMFHPSPSGLSDGSDGVVRSSNDWMIQDQASLACELGNWNLNFPDLTNQ